MTENELTEDPIIKNFLQQYPETSWNQVLRIIAIHGIQSLNISPEKQSYTLEELEKLVEPQLTAEELEKQEPKEETSQKDDKEMNENELVKEDENENEIVKEKENESQHEEQTEEIIEHVEQNNDTINTNQHQQEQLPQQKQTKIFISNYKNVVKSFPEYKTNNSNYSFQNQYSTKYMYKKKEGINCRHQRNQNECISCKTSNILGRNRFTAPSQISSPQFNFNYSNKY